MLEGQFALTFDRASQEKGVVGETLLSKLELVVGIRSLQAELA